MYVYSVFDFWFCFDLILSVKKKMGGFVPIGCLDVSVLFDDCWFVSILLRSLA